MTETSARLELPLIQAGQAQKELFHNEALLRLDALVHGAVAGPPQDAPPSAPAVGQAWIVGAAPTGDWAGHAGAVAAWTAGGWRFVAPREGMALWSLSAGTWTVRAAAGWQAGVLPASEVRVGGVKVVGARGAPVADPAGGATVDAEARAAIAAVLAALRGHGLIAT